jgi:hypothetical protein
MAWARPTAIRPDVEPIPAQPGQGVLAADFFTVETAWPRTL